MLGAGFLIARTTGKIHERSFRTARLSGWLTIVISIAIYIGTSVLHPEMTEKWTEWPPSPLYYFSALALGAFVMYFRSLHRKNDLAPIVWNWLIIIFSFTGLSIGLYPRMIPSIDSAALTVEEVAASPTTLRFMLAVMAILLPIILTYTSYSYWIFRGKASKEGYAADE
jgi:cytochrome d ubiquinol oxidase subunit II